MTTFLSSAASTLDPTSYTSLNALLGRSAGRPSQVATPVRDDQLRALRRRWNAALSAQLDSAIEFAGGQPLRDAVADAWTRLAEQQPELRAVLDAHATEAGSDAAAEHEARMLALAAGLVDPDDSPHRAARLGGSYLAEIRSRGRLAAASRG
ncbi:MAG TPA: hypothetical protein VNP03_02835 [Pseudonocardia sp.]|nr:hypothetical protein [Pseudonocardia sp.]